MSKIVRYIHDENFKKFKSDIAFLVKKIMKSKGELDLQLRDDYVNIYYKGNSLANIAKLKGPNYKIVTHSTFKLNEAVKKDKNKRFESRVKPLDKKNLGHYIKVSSDELQSLLQESVIKFLQKEIKARGYGEEIAFEQCLITDNFGRRDFFFIDRQVKGGGIPGTLDLLGLKEQESGKYSFVVLEVKLGNNPELSGKVADQLQRYKKAIIDNIAAFKECYEKNYMQKRSLGLFPSNFPENISIDERVEGRVVVGFYSFVGKENIDRLLSQHPNLEADLIICKNKLKI